MTQILQKSTIWSLVEEFLQPYKTGNFKAPRFGHLNCKCNPTHKTISPDTKDILIAASQSEYFQWRRLISNSFYGQSLAKNNGILIVTDTIYSMKIQVLNMGLSPHKLFE